jgi:type IV pilus assembly protein PilC
MPKFTYSALDADSNRLEGVVSGKDNAIAMAKLQAQGLRPLRVVEKPSILSYEITPDRVKPEEVMHFSRQLGVFVKAGIPIMDALAVIASETEDKRLRKVLLKMIDDLFEGETFSAAAASHPEVFPNYYVGILQSAELTGHLDRVLNQLADYIQRDIDAKKQFTAALIYPAIVLFMAVGVVIVLCGFVLPKFEVFFTQLHAKLPLPTRIMLGFSALVSTYWWVIALVALAAFGFYIWTKRSDQAKTYLDATILKLPIVGDLMRTAIVERVSRVLASMIDTGVPLPEALTVAADCANNIVFRRGIEQIRTQMMEGQGIAGPLAETGLFPSAAQQMFRVGEETGTLNEQMETAANYFKRELDQRIKHFTSLFEPLVIVGVGVVVGFVAIALVSAMYGVYSQVH